MFCFASTDSSELFKRLASPYSLSSASINSISGLKFPFSTVIFSADGWAEVNLAKLAGNSSSPLESVEVKSYFSSVFYAGGYEDIGDLCSVGKCWNLFVVVNYSSVSVSKISFILVRALFIFAIFLLNLTDYFLNWLETSYTSWYLFGSINFK
jgi:hypothetical protein